MPFRPEHRNRVPGLDVLRTLAIFLVFLWHTSSAGGPEWVTRLARFGWVGVDLFFVLSGFLIGSQLLGPVARGFRPSMREFYLKRFFRILPNFWVVLALYSLVPGFGEGSGLLPLWRFFTFTTNFGFGEESPNSFVHAWSLCIEEHFYLILPLLVILGAGKMKARHVLAGIGAVLAGGIAFRYLSYEQFVSPLHTREFNPALMSAYYEWIHFPTYNRFDGLLMGVAAALLYRFRRDLWEKALAHGNLLFVAGSVFLALGAFSARDLYSLSSALWAFPCFAIGFTLWLMAAQSDSALPFRWKIPGTRWGAELAFAIYLLDKPMIHLAHRLGSAWGWEESSNATLALSVPLILGAAALLHVLVEKPMLRARDRWVPRWTRSEVPIPIIPGSAPVRAS